MLIELNSKINDKSKREKKIADIDWNQSLSAIQSNWKMSKKIMCVCVCSACQFKENCTINLVHEHQIH